MKRIYHQYIVLLFCWFQLPQRHKACLSGSLARSGHWLWRNQYGSSFKCLFFVNNSAAAVWANGKGAALTSYTLWQTGLTNHMGALSGFHVR